MINVDTLEFLATLKADGHDISTLMIKTSCPMPIWRAGPGLLQI